MRHAISLIMIMMASLSASHAEIISFDTVPGRSGPLENNIFTARPITREYPGIEFFPDPRTSPFSGPVVLRYEESNPSSAFLPPRNGEGALYLWPGLNNRPFPDRPMEVRPMVDFLNMIFDVPITYLSFWIRLPQVELLPFDGLYTQQVFPGVPGARVEYFSAPSSSAWTFIEMQFTQSNPLASISISTALGRNGLASARANPIAIDDLFFTPIPAPSAGAVFALSIFPLAKRRSRS
jgi:hypothetical protein